MKYKKPIFYILLITLITRLLFFFDYHEIWWDSAVYIGMGKYLFSFAQQGLWEPIRPILWPIILGFIWKIKLDPVFFGRLLTLIISLAIIYLTYSVTNKIYNKDTAIISSILIAFSSVFFFFDFRIYTEIPAVLFVLLALLFSLKNRSLFSGFFIGLAFLTKFPAGIFLICLLPLIIEKKKIKNLLYYGLGFLIPVIPYFILNQMMYGNFLFPLIEASNVIKKVAGCNYLRYQPWFYYFVQIVKDNFFNIFALAGIYFSIKKLSRKNLSILLGVLLPLIYFTHLHCRDIRYLIIFIPFISILAGNGIEVLSKKIKKQKRIFMLLIILVISITLSITYYIQNESKFKVVPKENFYEFAQNEEIEKEIWATTPLVNLYVSKEVKLLYYPLYGVGTILDFENYVNYENISYVFLDTCGGGMTCIPEDKQCMQKTTDFINKLDSTFDKVYNESFGVCNYYIFREK